MLLLFASVEWRFESKCVHCAIYYINFQGNFEFRRFCPKIIYVEDGAWISAKFPLWITYAFKLKATPQKKNHLKFPIRIDNQMYHFLRVFLWCLCEFMRNHYNFFDKFISKFGHTHISFLVYSFMSYFFSSAQSNVHSDTANIETK